MTASSAIFAEIDVFLRGIDHETRLAEDTEITLFIGKVQGLMASLDIVCSVLRLPYGTPAEADYDKLDQALIQVDKIWKEFDLSYTPKYHGLDTHAAAQMKRIGGFGDMLEDDLEKSHQDCDRFGQRVARLKSAPLKAAAFSHHERTINDPKVQATRAAVIARTTRKRKEAGPTKAQGNTATKKAAREDGRDEHLSTEQSKPAGPVIQPHEISKKEYKNNNT
jgi:hypothetical protein